MPASSHSRARTAGGAPRVEAREWRALAALIAVALCLRCLHWHRTPSMFNDGPRYLSQAELFFRGDWSGALADVYHPLYAALVALVQVVFGPAQPSPTDWETAAVAVSIAAGSLAVVPFYFYVRSAFELQYAWIGAGLLAVHAYSVEFSSDVQSDGLYHALFLASVASAWSGLSTRRPGPAVWAGIFSGLAYLTRPEGLGVALVAAAAVCLGLALRQWRLPQAARWLAALAFGAALLVGPYLVVQGAEYGSWTLTRKKSLSTLAGVTHAQEGEAADRLEPGAQVEFSATMREAMQSQRAQRQREWQEQPQRSVWRWRAAATYEVVHAAESALRPDFLFAALVGMLALRGRIGLRGLFVASLGLVYLAAVLALTWNYGYVSRRHVLPPATLLLGYAAVGVPLLGRGLLWLGGRRWPRLREAAPRVAVALGLAVMVGFALGKQLRPDRYNSWATRVAAEWLRENRDPSGPVAADRRRVAYYAGAPWFPLRKLPNRVADVGGLLRSNGVRYVIADESDLDRHPALADPRQLGRLVVHRVEFDEESALVFDLEAQKKIGAAEER